MTRGRLEAFSDGVLAIILTIMVLELKPPHSASVESLRPLLPIFTAYVLSFIYVGIYWNNHHHLMHLVTRISGGILWANLHLLFWLSLVPFTTAWMGVNRFATLPMMVYGTNLLLSGVAFTILVKAIVVDQGPESALAKAIGNDRKGKASIGLYAISLPCALISPWIAGGFFVAVAVMWLVPDRRVERVLFEDADENR